MSERAGHQVAPSSRLRSAEDQHALVERVKPLFVNQVTSSSVDAVRRHELAGKVGRMKLKRPGEDTYAVAIRDSGNLWLALG